MAKESMEIELLSGALGAEIKGINLKDTSKDNHKKINDLLLEHKVIFFRNQDITPEEQIKLANCFGPLETHVYVKGRKDYPEIVRIIKEPEKPKKEAPKFNEDLAVISRMNQEFAVSLDLNETLKTALKLIVKRINAQAANIFLIEERKKVLQCIASVSYTHLTLPTIYSV